MAWTSGNSAQWPGHMRGSQPCWMEGEDPSGRGPASLGKEGRKQKLYKALGTRSPSKRGGCEIRCMGLPQGPQSPSWAQQVLAGRGHGAPDRPLHMGGFGSSLKIHTLLK